MSVVNGQIQKFRLRVTFSKTDDVSMLSHLEIARALEKTIRRANLNYCVSQGFSPHMRVSFGRAISVGVSSENEIFDVYLREYVDQNKALQMLQNASCESLPILDAKYVDNSCAAASTCYIASCYEVSLSGVLSEMNIPDTVEVAKKSKTKIIDVNKYLDGEVEIKSNPNSSTLIFTMRIIDGSSIKPQDFVTAILKGAGSSHLNIVSIKKKNILNSL